jgi:hypothetical protein
MTKQEIIKQEHGSLKGHDHQAEVVSFLRRLIVKKNDVTDEDHEYHTNEIKKIYKRTLQYTTEKAGRIPTLNEILDGVFQFNYTILWELSSYDFKNGLGNYGYAQYINFSCSYGSENEYIEEIFENWENHLSADLCLDPQKYLSQILCENNLSYYDDINIMYQRTSSYNITICANDCQNILLPKWHYKSISCHSMFEDTDYIMKIQYLSKQIKYIEKGENENNEQESMELSAYSEGGI